MAQLLRNRNFMLLMSGFSIAMGAVWALLMVESQLIQPCGYSDEFAGFCGACLLGTGVVAAFALSYVMETTKECAAGGAAEPPSEPLNSPLRCNRQKLPRRGERPAEKASPTHFSVRHSFLPPRRYVLLQKANLVLFAVAVATLYLNNRPDHK